MTISDETLAALRERYTTQEVPPCSVCGAKLIIAAMGGGDATVWACADRPHVPGDTDAWYDHYARSKFRQVRSGDSDVLELVKEFELFRQQRGQLALALDDVLWKLHPVYGSTTGPYAGVGGQAMTPWCHVNSPYTEEHEVMRLDADNLLHDVMGVWSQEELDDIKKRAKEMHAEIEKYTD